MPINRDLMIIHLFNRLSTWLKIKHFKLITKLKMNMICILGHEENTDIMLLSKKCQCHKSIDDMITFLF